MKRKSNEDDSLRPEYDFTGGVRGKYAWQSLNISADALTIPVDWVSRSAHLSSIARDVCADALTFSSNVSDLLSTQATSILSDQFTALSGKISADALGLSRLVSNADLLGQYSTMASSLLGDPSTMATYVNVPSALAATTAYLDTAGALASAIRVDTSHLAGLDFSSSLLTSLPNIASSVIADVSQLVDSGSLLNLADRFQLNISSAADLIDTSLAASRLTSEVFSIATGSALSSYISSTAIQLSDLSRIGTSVYADLAKLTAVDTSSFLFAAPTIEPYAQIQATSVVLGVPEDRRERQAVPSVDSLLDELGDELEERLAALDPRLAEVYVEAVERVRSGGRGWIRHAGVSLRTLFDHLLRLLAPSDVLDGYFKDPRAHKVDGEYRRAARLEYIFREVAVGSYSRMADHDIKLAEATFFPANEIVHKLDAPLSERQMKVLVRRVQGSVSVVLAAAGY